MLVADQCALQANREHCIPNYETCLWTTGMIVWLKTIAGVITSAMRHKLPTNEGRTMLKKNQPAPPFSSPNQDNQPVSLSDYQGKNNVVLYFYPKDDTPGCTIEANDFTKLANEFTELDTVVIGVSKDSCESHQAFIEKYGLNVELLADTSGEMCDSYGVWQEKEKQGVKKMGIVRSTFIINKDGIVEEAMYGVSADGHAQEVLGKIKQLN
jgi:peroxiredoxin Q/BCP